MNKPTNLPFDGIFNDMALLLIQGVSECPLLPEEERARLIGHFGRIAGSPNDYVEEVELTRKEMGISQKEYKIQKALGVLPTKWRFKKKEDNE